MSVNVRAMGRSEFETAVEWAAREGWNPGLDDSAAFFAADPEGFLLAEQDGEVVATISAVKYGSDFGFIGFYIVKPDLRGLRHGLTIGERALERLEGRNVGIDGVLAKQRQYAKLSGFEFAYRNLRFGGEVAGGSFAPNIVPASTLPFAKLSTYDRRFFPAEREVFLRGWLAMPHAEALCWMEGDTLRGYGVIRQCREGFKIGPLFADDSEIAEELLHALCRNTRGQPVFLDVPEVNPAAISLATRHGMKEVFATARMYNRGIPALELGGIFGVTTFELG